MSRRAYLMEILGITLLMVLLTALFSANGVDMAVERHFYLPGAGWAYGNDNPWWFLYHFGVLPAYLVGVGGLIVYGAGFRWERLRPFRKSALFLALLLALGPGLLVNTVFKDHWGRPRPRQMELFGGDRHYHQVWEPGQAGKGESFPSGHASAAFYLIAPYFLFRRRSRNKALAFLAGGLGYGFLMGVARMAQGGHFPSDVLWAFGMVYLTGSTLGYVMKLGEEPLPAGK